MRATKPQFLARLLLAGPIVLGLAVSAPCPCSGPGDSAVDSCCSAAKARPSDANSGCSKCGPESACRCGVVCHCGEGAPISDNAALPVGSDRPQVDKATSSAPAATSADVSDAFGRRPMELLAALASSAPAETLRSRHVCLQI